MWTNPLFSAGFYTFTKKYLTENFIFCEVALIEQWCPDALIEMNGQNRSSLPESSEACNFIKVAREVNMKLDFIDWFLRYLIILIK